MKATRKNFEKKMRSLSTEQIVELLRSTWNEAVGELFREIGFEIIEEREGEDESDRVYNRLWQECRA